MALVRHSARCIVTFKICLYTRLQSTAVTRITVPQRMVDKLYTKKVKLMQKKAKEIRHTGPVVIHCRHKEFNHHKGQKYTKFNERSLASAYWKNRKRVGDHFVINSTGKNPALLLGGGALRTFDAMGLRQDIVCALHDLGIKTPTNIQSKSIPTLLEGRNVLCTAETGSGKTLAYLLPIIQSILEKNESEGVSKRRNHPLGVIVVPSHELADQVYGVATRLTQNLDLNVTLMCGRNAYTYLRKRHQEPMDLVIASPGILSKAIALGVLDMTRLSTLVLDEADTLLDDSFNYIITKILTRTCDSIAQYRGIETENPEILHNVDKQARSHWPNTGKDHVPLESTNDESECHEISEDVGAFSDEIAARTGEIIEATDHFEATNFEQEIEFSDDTHMSLDNMTTLDNMTSVDKMSSTDDLTLVGEMTSDDDITSDDDLMSDDDEMSEEFNELHEHLQAVTDTNYNTASNETVTHRSDSLQQFEDLSTDGLFVDGPVSKVHIQDSPVQFCMIGATIPTTMDEVFGALVPKKSITIVRTSSIHRILPNVAHKFVRCTGVSKLELILRATKNNIKTQVPTIVFCNNIKTVRYLMHTFNECGVKPVSVLYSDKSRKYDRTGVFHDFESGKTDVLLCTDLASRGLDTVRARVVINYDCPQYMADYIHRAGRVGRVGGQTTGVVCTYVQQRWDVDLVWKIETAVRQDTKLYNVDSNIKGVHENRHRKMKQEQPKIVDLHV